MTHRTWIQKLNLDFSPHSFRLFLPRRTEILRSRDPDLSLRWPDVFSALVRMPNSAMATKRLFDYSVHADEEVSLTVKKAPSLPILVLPDYELLLPAAFQDRALGIETGKFLISTLHNYPRLPSPSILPFALEWAICEGLPQEAQRLLQRFHRMTTGYGLVEHAYVRASQIAIDSNQLLVLKRFLDEIRACYCLLHG